MVDLITILYPENENILPGTINYNTVDAMYITSIGAITMYLENRKIVVEIRDELGVEDITTTKKAFQAILNAVEILPGGKVTTVEFPPNVKCESVSIQVY